MDRMCSSVKVSMLQKMALSKTTENTENCLSSKAKIRLFQQMIVIHQKNKYIAFGADLTKSEKLRREIHFLVLIFFSPSAFAF